jgi:cyclohexanone monooxygenase
MKRQIEDQELAAKLLPRYALGCKRPAISNTYLPTFNRDNVELVTEGIERISPEGIVTEDGQLHAIDALILATGFLTTERGNAPSFEVVGTDGVELGQFWEDHRLQAYAGVSVPGFPNFFLTAGPYAGGFNWFAMLEANLGLIMRCIDGARARGVTRVEVDAEAHERYMRHMWRRAEGTVFQDGGCLTANSYYLDRHGDASLPLPHTPWWRALRGRLRGAHGFRFGAHSSS